MKSYGIFRYFVLFLSLVALMALLSCQPEETPTDSTSDPDPDGSLTEPSEGDLPDTVEPNIVGDYLLTGNKGSAFVPLAHYPEDDVIVCIKNVLDYGAKADGSKDASAAIQKALDAAAQQGGGTVYMPAGTYYLKDKISIPDAVVLCGDWVSPEIEPAGTSGTIILVDYKGRTPQPQYGCIRLGSSSGLRNVTIYQVNQSLEAPSKLSPTVWGANQSSPTIENVTILNAYSAVSFGEGEGMNSSLITMTNVYISTLYSGVTISNSYDTTRLENVHVSPEYLAENVIVPMSEEQKSALCDYTFQNVTGITLYRGDATGLYDTFLELCRVGIHLTEDPYGSGVTSGAIVLTEVENCDVGIWVEQAHGVGTSITGFTATATRNCTSAIETGEKYTAHTKVEDGSITGTYLNAGVVTGAASLSFTDMTFDINSTDYVLLALRGVLSCTACHFEDANVVSDAGGAAAFYLVDCTYAKEMTNEVGSRSKLVNTQSGAIYEPISSYHVYRDTLPGPARQDIVSVKDFGAVGNGKTDDSQAFQAALDEMGKRGGGIVFVPNGRYVIKECLTVPSGVELTGVLGALCYSADALRTSCLLLYAGANNPNGDAAISLQENAGIRGLVAWYPEQDIDNLTEYSYAIRSLGKNAYAINVNICNAYQYMDFGSYPSAGHYVRNCGGMAILRGMYIGNNDGEGWVENVHLNQHQIYGLQIKGESGGYAPEEFDHAVYDILIKEMEGFVFGYNQNEHVLGTFCLGSYAVYLFEEQDGKSTRATLVQIGADGCRDSIVVDQAEELHFIAPGNVSLGSDSSRTYLRTNDTFDGVLNIWGSGGYGGPTHGMILEGGTIQISTFTFAAFTAVPPIWLGGEADVTLTSCVIPFASSSAMVVPSQTYSGMYEEAGTLCLGGSYGYQLIKTFPD